LMRFLPSGTPWIESPSIIPARSPPSGKLVIVSFAELREDFARGRVVTTE
jgi:hypothetical protein